MLTMIPAPDPLPLPAPPSLLWGLLLLTFFLHLLAMNFVLGGSLIAAAGRLRGGDDRLLLTKRIGKAMPVMIAAAITFGVAPLLFLQALYGRLFFTSSILMAWLWLAVIPVLILAYYAAYAISFRGGGRGLVVFVAFAFLAISFVYTNNMTLMLRPERFLPMAMASDGGLLLNLSDSTLIPRWLHMVLGAVAIAGFIIALYGAVRSRTEASEGNWAMRHGGLWFTGATLVNVLTGLWWLVALPRPVLLRFMGQSTAGTVALAAGIVFGFVALAMMFGAVTSGSPRKLVLASTAPVALTLIAMIVARDDIRRSMLAGTDFHITTLVEPQWAVIFAFVVLLVIAASATVWMTRLLVRR
jgi:hypothetical protein